MGYIDKGCLLPLAVVDPNLSPLASHSFRCFDNSEIGFSNNLPNFDSRIPVTFSNEIFSPNVDCRYLISVKWNHLSFTLYCITFTIFNHLLLYYLVVSKTGQSLISGLQFMPYLLACSRVIPKGSQATFAQRGGKKSREDLLKIMENFYVIRKKWRQQLNLYSSLTEALRWT